MSGHTRLQYIVAAVFVRCSTTHRVGGSPSADSASVHGTLVLAWQRTVADACYQVTDLSDAPVTASLSFKSTACWQLLPCRLRLRISCVSGASYDAVVQFLDEGRVAQWPTRDCFPYLGAASSSEACLQLNSGLCSSQLPEGEVAWPCHMHGHGVYAWMVGCAPCFLIAQPTTEVDAQPACCIMHIQCMLVSVVVTIARQMHI